MEQKEDRRAAVVLFLLGLGYLVAATQYPIGEISNPGPGFTPRLLGIIFTILSGYLLVKSFIGSPKETRQPAQEEGAPPGCKEAVQVAKVMTTLILYVAAMHYLGFALSTFLAICLTSRFMGLEGWRKPAFLGVGTVVLAQLLFVLALDVPLPVGIIWGR
jgi:hypothetical protein